MQSKKGFSWKREGTSIEIDAGGCEVVKLTPTDLHEMRKLLLRKQPDRVVVKNPLTGAQRDLIREMESGAVLNEGDDGYSLKRPGKLATRVRSMTVSALLKKGVLTYLDEKADRRILVLN